jgi:hypothetical protein
MKIRDAQEQLVWDSVVSVAVLGKGREFMLITLPTDPADAAKLAEAQRRGYFYAAGYSESGTGSQARSVRARMRPSRWCTRPLLSHRK